LQELKEIGGDIILRNKTVYAKKRTHKIFGVYFVHHAKHK